MKRRPKDLAKLYIRNGGIGWAWWFTPIILATQQAEIRRIAV
jgi:hypothetical protein